MKFYQGLLVTAALLMASVAYGEQRFSDLVGPVGVEPVKTTPNGAINVPFITWGGDVAEFVANGNSLTTTKGSINNKLGLNVNLTKGDDFVQQVRDYVTGKSPFIRGTIDMIGQASEVLGADPATKPIVIVQLTWSAGDHVVTRPGVKTINDLVSSGKKMRWALQQGGPHVGFAYKIQQAVQANKNNVELVWCQDLTGPKGPADAFRKDPTIDAAFVITPDMLGLCGGQDQVGNGAEGTVKGAHVVVSTQQMTRAIPDVWAVRSDWYKNNKLIVDMFVAGYLAATEEVVALRKGFTDKLSPEYKKVLTFAQATFGKEVIPTLEVDGHGLLLDAMFVGLPGQVAFFDDKGNLSGFDTVSKQAIDLAVDWGYAKIRSGFMAAQLDYNQIAALAGIKYEAPVKTARIDAESVKVFPDSNLDDRTIMAFTINFEPNQTEFSSDQYGSEFNRVVESASTFGNAVIVVRGHSDPTKTLVDLVQAGLAPGRDGRPSVLNRSGSQGSYHYFYNGKELNLADTPAIVGLIKGNAFDTANTNISPRETMQAALNLSMTRAAAVKDAVADYAKKIGKNLDVSQIQPVGAGISEPLIAKPKNIAEAKQNMRVEFRIIRVPAEAIKAQDFDY